MHDGRSPTSSAPPYLGYRTLQNFLFSLRQGVPQRIDRTLMPRLGGTVQKQLLHALRYLGFITEAGVTEPSLKQLVFAEGAERKKLLQAILQSAYPFLCGDGADGFDLTTATLGQLQERFQTFGIRGETARKAATFFVHGAIDAGMTTSPHIYKSPGKPNDGDGQPPRPRHSQRSHRRNASNKSRRSSTGNNRPPPTPPGQDSATPRSDGRQMVIQALVTKMPEFNPAWEPDLVKTWLETFDRVADRLLTATEDTAGGSQKETPEEGA